MSTCLWHQAVSAQLSLHSGLRLLLWLVFVLQSWIPLFPQTCPIGPPPPPGLPTSVLFGGAGRPLGEQVRIQRQEEESSLFSGKQKEQSGGGETGAEVKTWAEKKKPMRSQRVT